MFFFFCFVLIDEPLEPYRVVPILADLVADHLVVAISSVDSEMLSVVLLEVESPAIRAGKAQPHQEMQ